MILERIKPDLDTPQKIAEAYSIFSAWLFSNFLFFFVIFYAVHISRRFGSEIGSSSFLIIIVVAIAFLYFSKKIFQSLLKSQSVRVNHIVFIILSAMNLILLTWILIVALS
jgi:quinol-cytochrome oxidoreductase complex cytochrome b subunit